MTSSAAVPTRHRGRRLLVPALYVGLLPAALLLFFAVSEAAFAVVYRLPDAIGRSEWIRFLLNYILPALWGWVWYGTLAFALRRYGWLDVGLRTHLARTGVLYGVAAVSAGLLANGWRTPDFWLYGQIPLWIGLISLHGAIADMVVARSQRRRSRPLAG